MDQQKFLEAATYVMNLKMFPFFDAANYIIMCLMVRDDNHSSSGEGQTTNRLAVHIQVVTADRSPKSRNSKSQDAAQTCLEGEPARGVLKTLLIEPGLLSGSTTFSRKQPLSCWISSMLMCFAGSILSNFLIGESVVAPFKNQNDVLLATAVWYVINYSPFDIGYKLCKFTPVNLVVSCMKQIQIVNKVQHGVNYGIKNYPKAYIIICLIGVMKGAGYCFMRLIERLVRGVWTPSNHELLQPSFATKASLAASIVFILQHYGYFTAPYAVVYFSIVVFFVYFNVSSYVFGVHDPFIPFENLFCALFLGGLVDSMKRAIGSKDSKGTSDISNQQGREKED